MATSAKKEVTCGYNGHYHLYMTIAVNSQDKTNNKSNVTVKMYAKSDSETYGAYNLSSSANSVKLTVDGSQKVNKSMAMDFRSKSSSSRYPRRLLIKGHNFLHILSLPRL